MRKLASVFSTLLVTLILYHAFGICLQNNAYAYPGVTPTLYGGEPTFIVSGSSSSLVVLRGNSDYLQYKLLCPNESGGYSQQFYNAVRDRLGRITSFDVDVTYTASNITYRFSVKDIMYNSEPSGGTCGGAIGVHFAWYLVENKDNGERWTISNQRYNGFGQVYSYDLLYREYKIQVKSIKRDPSGNATGYTAIINDVTENYGVPDPKGELKVTLEPAEARLAGAQYRMESCAESWYSTWRNSGITSLNLSPGYHKVCYKEIEGWPNPPCEDIEVVANQISEITRNYGTTTGDAGTLQFSPATYNVNENGGSATITVTRSGGSSGAVRVTYATSNGTATAGSDYTAQSGTLSWADGDSASKTFTVPIINDSNYETNETVNLTLSNPTGGVTLGTPSTAVLTISSDDSAPAGTLQFSPATYNVNENGGSATITVTRTGGSSGAVGLTYATSNGTATAGSDYTAQSGTLSWADGDSASKTLTVSITNDSDQEASESFTVTLSNPTGGAALGSPSSATVGIIDDEDADTALLYADYGSSGTWMYNGTWTKLTPADAQGMASSGSLLYADYGSSGTWMYNGITWAKLTPADPESMTASGSLLYADYGSSGIWMYNGSTWTRLSPADPESMTASGSLLYADYGSSGIWMYDGSVWTKLKPATPKPKIIVVSGSFLYVAYEGSGIWMYDGSVWTKLTPATPQNMAAFGAMLYADFGSSGTWMYNGSTWTKLTPADPQNLAASGSMLYADYGSSGTWVYNGSTWTKLSPADPESMTAPQIVEE